MRYFLSLGSNVGNRRTNLELAIRTLKAERVCIIQSSSLYETEPVDLPLSDSQRWFYNQVVEVDIDIEPMALLNLVKRIEKKMGRKTSMPKAPRNIDIDILLAENRIFQTEDLVIPHPRLEKRNFTLIPLREISPETQHPVLKQTIKELADTSPDQHVVRKVE